MTAQDENIAKIAVVREEEWRELIFALLFGLALVSSLLVGYGMASSKGRNWLHMLGLAFVMAVSVYVILDIEYPRLGLIRVDSFDQPWWSCARA